MTVRLPLLPSPIRWSIVVGIVAGIFYASVTSDPPDTVGSSNIRYASFDAWGHFVAYSMLGYALAYATDGWQMRRWYAAAFVVGSTSLCGFGIELVQHFLPDRTFAVEDIAANALGALLALPWYLVRPYLELEPISEG